MEEVGKRFNLSGRVLLLFTEENLLRWKEKEI